MKLTWGGHSTVLIEIGGKVILTDPNLAKRLFFFKRYSKPGLTDADLQRVDIVLVSHAHFDHLDHATMKRIPKRAKVYTVGKIREIVNRWGFKSIGMEFGETIQEDGLRITLLPAKHFGGRWRVNGDEKKYRFGSFLIQSDSGETLYFAGDTAYADHFKHIAQRFPRIDLALIPIGAYEPRRIMQAVHVNPIEAVQAFLDLGATRMVPIHFGTFKLTKEQVDVPPLVLRDEAARLNLTDRVHIFEPGESRSFDF